MGQRPFVRVLPRIAAGPVLASLMSVVTTGVAAADPPGYTIQRLGPTDAAHTGYDGLPTGVAQFVDAAGQVAGTAERYVDRVDEGPDAWAYSPTAGTSVVVGLTDAAHTESG